MNTLALWTSLNSRENRVRPGWIRRRSPGKPMRLLCLLGLLWAAAWPLAMGGKPGPQVWPVDPLEKVFRDAKPLAVAVAQAEAARGEHAAFQIVLRAEQPIQGLNVEIGDLRGPRGSAVLRARPVRFVGYVPVDRPTQKPSRDQLRKPPADFPDPLLEAPVVEVRAGEAQPVWLTVPIPLDATPGNYRGVLKLAGSIEGKVFHRKQPLSLRVYRAVAGPAPLWVTEWYALHSPHMKVSPAPDSEESYALLRRYARNMADHRHNVALISPLALADYRVDATGALSIDFRRFDRWVRIFQEEGVIGRIEGGHIGGRKAGWESEFSVTIQRVKDGRAVAEQVDPASAEADAFYGKFFPALISHLRAKGWLDLYLQHLADEPIASNITSYRAMAALARKYGPELRIVEACHTKDLVGSIDVWVPQLNYLQEDLAHYQARQKAGEEVWFYTCVFPQGEYANRFIEQPLIKTRLLHWINFRYGVNGYLHWGYNHWTAESPFTHTTRPHGGPPYLPAGDPWIVYPGTDGPLDSIRFEAMRDGIADFALLDALAKRDRGAAEALAARMVAGFDRYDTDLTRFRAARQELLRRLSE